MEYYFKYTRESNKEIVLYRILRLTDWMEEDELWMKVYEYGIKKKVKPRSSLRKEYARKKDML